uniref:Ribonuclease HII n=1 Tax=viral metagenome TaxID=1070528 RepID=A0A6C0HXE9_9ZZZZ
MDTNTLVAAAEVEAEKPKKVRVKQQPLNKYYSEDENIVEIGVDEVGRGPLFGRVYTAAVILPKDDSFDHSKMKDSKKFHSKQKILEAAEYIKQNAIAWSVGYESETTIDEINILQATQQAMHSAINKCIDQQQSKQVKLLVDGNYFKPIVKYNPVRKMLEQVDYVCVEGGDNKYTAIAAASIIAKVARDTYIEELCSANPELIEKYGIDSNKGYGAKKHMDGIKEHGITIWHRRSFGPCKDFA